MGANGSVDGVVTGATCSTGAGTGAIVEVPAGGPVSSVVVVTGAMMGVSAVGAGVETSTSQGWGRGRGWRWGGGRGVQSLLEQAASSFSFRGQQRAKRLVLMLRNDIRCPALLSLYVTRTCLPDNVAMVPYIVLTAVHYIILLSLS